MKCVSIIKKIAIVFAVATCTFFLVNFLLDSPEISTIQSSEIQCAHWSILRSSQLLGVPVGLDYLTKRLPTQRQGHSMLQMSNVLREIGFETEGRRETLQTLKHQTFPGIAHLTNPDHYVVISAVDDKYVHIFDGDGRRIARDHVSFGRRWSGNILFVRKPATPGRLPAFLPQPVGDVPLAQFDTLIRDLGTIPATGEPVTFSFTVKNVGRKDLIVKQVLADCACIESRKTELPIQPGETGIIELSYHVQPQRGPFSHTIIIRTNDPQIPIFVVIASGWSGVDVQVSPHYINLHNMVSGHEKTFRCFVRFTGEGQDLQVQIGDTALGGASLIDYTLTPVTEEIIKDWFSEFPIRSGAYAQAYVLDLTFMPQGNTGDIVSGAIVLNTNIEGYEKFTLNVFGRLESPIRSFPTIVRLLDIDQNEITLVSRIDEPFEIVSIFQGENDFAWNSTNDTDNERMTSLSLGVPSHEVSVSQPMNIRVRFPKSDKYYDVPIRVIP